MKIRRPVRKPIVTTRKVNDIRIALALRHSMAPLPPPMPQTWLQAYLEAAIRSERV